MGKSVDLTPSLRAEYERLYSSSGVRPDRRAEVTSIVNRIMGVWPRYEAVAESIGVPAVLVGLIHAMECGCRFDRHLHNGDPLTARTVHVPAGRPASGHPPFSWEASAADALKMHSLDEWTDWSLPGLAYVLERYNGWGYRSYHPAVPSPYLWSMTTASKPGKYVADGHFDPQAVSKQPGAMALLMGLHDAGWAKAEV